ncbi:hypothetical protein PFICI_11302 [Pestalotiopsis fici W106-1]|uniref:Intradiol ring-cleavage dioxygenases domain-containing protein n=1 Tax=Pestalotiopsis fici (strain W106-1 / CGMCC3.15140) TaxID=1229662 RepID=W3WU70_PESFW|nr:uncharacterized protein PFICI_11302 [Pestalotiopsis fici W106-1]ETS77428.1 hypothetical protein PFICI_11302 [Pestalotiopsis fici W106-1]
MLGFKTLLLSLEIASTVAHPGEKHSVLAREGHEHRSAVAQAQRSLSFKAETSVAVALKSRAVARRAKIAATIREKRAIQNKPLVSRDLEQLEAYDATSHDIFGSNSTTGLTPQAILGPYFVAGEWLRTDITEGTQGVPLHLDIQFVDIATFNPIPRLAVDVWHCNATGVYSGINATLGQGGLNTTFLRGVSITDDDGVVQFDTLFPGHYSGRSQHIHVIGTENARFLHNGTYLNGTARHIGQIFFNQDLISEVETTEPYVQNTVNITTNVEDLIAPDAATATYDPLADYVRLGDSISDGLLSFITIGINTTADYSANIIPASHYYETGGVDTGTGGLPPGAPSPP